MSGSPWKGRSTAGILAVAFLAVALWMTWGYSDRLERDNAFCNACHLSDGTPLHLEIRERFDRVVPSNLAGVHGRGWVEDRPDPAFRCVDCHAGSGMVERTRVKLLAARDAIRYLAGRFEEPRRMDFDLSPATCLHCHGAFRHSAAPGWTFVAYHGRPEHAPDRGPACVRCHAVHETDGDPFAYFMNRPRVDRQCRICHVPGGEMEIPSLLSEAQR